MCSEYYDWGLKATLLLGLSNEKGEVTCAELPFGSQSHSRISSLCVCARVPFAYKPSLNIMSGS